jgi:hypothetical protein
LPAHGNSGRVATTVGALSLLMASGTVFATPAAASGCTTPPCGRVVNNTNVNVQVQITPSDIRNLGRGGIGGWPGVDVDFYRIQPRCSATVVARGLGSHPAGPVIRSGGSTTWSPWFKLSSSQTVTITSMNCRAG